jgi:hypothetical protein
MKTVTVITAIVAAVMPESVSHADNPIIQTMYTADPAPLVYFYSISSWNRPVSLSESPEQHHPQQNLT